jgi:hypothetical protein
MSGRRIGLFSWRLAPPLVPTTRVAKATLEKRIVRKYNIFLRKQHFLVLDDYDPQIHAVYFCPQLYKPDSEGNLIPLEGDEIGRLRLQSLQTQGIRTSRVVLPNAPAAF